MPTVHHIEKLPDHTDAHAKQILAALPLRHLWIQTSITGLLFLAFVALDAAINWKSVGSSFTLDEYGLDTGNTLVAAGFSLLTVLAWLLVGGIYAAGFRRTAGAAYALVMVIVGFLVAPVALPFIAERLASFGFDAAPVWSQALGLCFFTILFSIPGLFLCMVEQRIAAIWNKWKVRAEVLGLLAARASASAALDVHASGAQKLIEQKRCRESDVAAVLQMVEQEIEGTRNQIAATAEIQHADMSLSKADRLHAWERVQAHGRVKTAGGVLVAALLLLTSIPAWSAPSPVDELLRHAPTLLVLLDNTGGSPALEPSILAQAEKSIQEKLARLPMGSSLIVFSVGDPKQIAELKRWRVQAKVTENGGPVAYLKARLHAHLLDFPARQHPEAHKESHLVQGWFDAAQLLNPKAETENAVIFVTDAMEFSPLANCYQACKLPKPTFTLPNTRLEMLGIGYSQSSAKTLAIWPVWKKFFAAAGIVNLQLLHMF
mgnify:CR=1 FL=1